MATENTVSTLDGMFKEIYLDLESSIPKFTALANAIPFRKADKQGDSYHFPVVVQRSHGVTFNGGASAGNAFTLNARISGVSKDATLSGSEMVIRDAISYGAAARATKGKAAFINATEHVVMSMMESMAFYRELQLLYGQKGVAQCSAASGAGTSRTFTISDATWAPGVWSQLVGASLDAYDDEDLSSKENSNAVVVVTAVDVGAKTVSVTGNGSDLTAMGTDAWLVPVGWKTNTAAGMTAILGNTGTLFGISAATYPLWKTGTYAVGSSAFTLGKLQSALVPAVGQGLAEEIELFVSPYTWADLNTDHAALRRFAESTKSGLDIGTKAITYYGANGSVKVKSHSMVMAGRAIGIVPSHWKRIGSSDITFNLPNSPVPDRFFRLLDGVAGYELQAYSDQAFVCCKPAQQLYATGITNDSD